MRVERVQWIMEYHLQANQDIVCNWHPYKWLIFSLCLTCKHSGAKCVLLFETILIIIPHLNLGTRIPHWWVQMREKYVSTHGRWFMAMKIYLIQPAKWSPEASNQENEIPGWVLPVSLLFNSMPLSHAYRAWSAGDSGFVNSNLAWRCWPWNY